MFLKNFYKKIFCSFCLSEFFKFLFIGFNSFICNFCIKFFNKLNFNKFNLLKNFNKIKMNNLSKFKLCYKNHNKCFKLYNYNKNLKKNIYNKNIKKNLNNFDIYSDFLEFLNFDEYNLNYKNLIKKFEEYLIDYNDEYFYYYYFNSNNFDEYNIFYNIDDCFYFNSLNEIFNYNIYDEFLEFYNYDFIDEYYILKNNLNNFFKKNFLKKIFYISIYYEFIFYSYINFKYNNFFYSLIFQYIYIIYDKFNEDNFYSNFLIYKKKYNFNKDDIEKELIENFKKSLKNNKDSDSNDEGFYEYNSDDFDYEKNEIFNENIIKINYNESLKEYINCKIFYVKNKKDKKTSKKIYKEYYEGKYEGINFRKFLNNFIYPNLIYDYLDKYVSGQNNAKKILSVSLYNYLKLIKFNFEYNFSLNKSNILIIGPSGSGKTYLIQILFKILKVPCLIVDSTSFTETGYVGDNVDNILQRLYEISNYDSYLTKMGLVYIDEFDKLAKKINNNNKDISGEGVQQALLKLIEGSDFSVFSKYGNEIINTKNILFICGGSFSGIEEIIKNRINKINIGFKKNVNNLNEYNNLIKNLTTEDLFKFGIIPELIGRLPLIIKFDELKIENLSNILNNCENSLISDYNDLMKPEGVKIYIDTIASNLISEIALKNKTGARGLKGIIDNIILEIIFNINILNNLKLILISKNLNKPILIFKSLKYINFDIPK